MDKIAERRERTAFAIAVAFLGSSYPNAALGFGDALIPPITRCR